jgi:NAD(P)-dependent dehydrogenase (short-subunit alcohol dehydrogenase family)
VAFVGIKMNKLHEKVAIVTGAAYSTGRAIAIKLAEEGAKVIVADLNTKRGQTTVDTITSRAGEAVFVRTDVSRSRDVQNMVRKCMKVYGKLNMLCNFAGTNLVTQVADLSERQWDRVMNVNLKGVFLSMKYAIPEMVRGGGGCIVNWTLNEFQTFSNEVSYISSGAVNILSKATALDYSSKNIRIHTVCPRGISILPISIYGESGLGTSKLNRGSVLKTTDEIASLVLFIACNES